MEKSNVIFEDGINYLQSIETELVEHFNELQNIRPDTYAEDHPMAQTIQALSQFINQINPTNSDPNVNPHCPFCFKPMQFTESNRFNGDEIKQHLACNDCDCIVYIHQFI